MKNETKTWLDYAAENIESARVLLDSNLFNSCLQNVQQCVEKLLKAVLVELSAKPIKTHSISRLKQALADKGLEAHITDDECDLLDTIFCPLNILLAVLFPIMSRMPIFAKSVWRLPGVWKKP